MKNGVAERVMPEIGIFSMKINVVLNGILDEKKTSQTDISTNKAEVD